MTFLKTLRKKDFNTPDHIWSKNGFTVSKMKGFNTVYFISYWLNGVQVERAESIKEVKEIIKEALKKENNK